MPAAAGGVASSGVAGNAELSGVSGGPEAVQAGGTDKCPIDAAWASSADIELPATPDNRCVPGPNPAANCAISARFPSPTMAPAPVLPSVEAVMAVTTWDGLNAPVEVTVFQKLAFGSRIDCKADPVEVVVAVAGVAMLCKLVGIEDMTFVNVACVSVVADVLVA
jgi:hypothetical protein